MEGKFVKGLHEIYTNINISVMLSTKGNEGMHIFFVHLLYFSTQQSLNLDRYHACNNHTSISDESYCY